MRYYILAGMLLWLACGGHQPAPRYQELVESGQFDSALVLLEQDQSQLVRNATAQFCRGKAYFGKGELEKAAAAFRASVTIDSSRFAGWYFTGLVYDRQGDYPAGYAAFTNALLCFPALRQGPWRDQRVEYIKNRFYLDMQDPLLTDLALKSLSYTLTANPAIGSLVALKAEALWQQYMERGGNDTKLVSAFQLTLGELMALLPESPEVHYIQGLYYRRENREQAETEWRQALTGDSTYVEAQCRLGEMYVVFNAFDKAAAVYEKALTVRPEYLPAMIGRGLVWLKQYRFAEAVRQFEDAVRIYPDAAVTHYNAGVAYEDNHQPARAADAYQRAITLDPRLAKAWYNQGRIHYFSGDFTASLQCLQQAVALDSFFYDASIFMANVHIKRRENSRARAVLEGVLQKDPANELARQNLAKLK